MMARIGAAALTALLAVAVLSTPGAAQELQDYRLEVQVGDRSVTYTYKQLEAMATEEVESSRKTKKHAAVRVDALVGKAMEGRHAGIAQVVLLGGERSMSLEGENLALLKHLVIKLGDNHPSIMPDSDEAYYKLQPIMGKPRLKHPKKIYIYEQHERH